MTLPLPTWCFLDGPLKGKCEQYQGKFAEAMTRNYGGRKRYTFITYKIVNHFKGDKDALVVLAKILPQQRRKWARIQRQMRSKTYAL